MTQMSLWRGETAVSCEEPPESPAGLPPPATATVPKAVRADASSETEAPAQDFHVTATALGAWLSHWFRQPVSVVFTENKTSMLSFREENDGARLRIHKMFSQAPEEVLWALAAYLRDGDRDAGAVVDAFIEARGPDFVKPSTLEPRGRFFDLQELFDELNALYFHGACRAQITWGKASARKYRRSIQLGCYIGTDRLIRIHPCLDQAFVPRYYVAWVVFHEMLHEVFGVGSQGKKRRSLHPPEFIAIEESYPDYRLCKRWEAKNLYRLLKYTPR